MVINNLKPLVELFIICQTSACSEVSWIEFTDTIRHSYLKFLGSSQSRTFFRACLKAQLNSISKIAHTGNCQRELVRAHKETRIAHPLALPQWLTCTVRETKEVSRWRRWRRVRSSTWGWQVLGVARWGTTQQIGCDSWMQRIWRLLITFLLSKLIRRHEKKSTRLWDLEGKTSCVERRVQSWQKDTRQGSCWHVVVQL